MNLLFQQTKKNKKHFYKKNKKNIGKINEIFTLF